MALSSHVAVPSIAATPRESPKRIGLPLAFVDTSMSPIVFGREVSHGTEATVLHGRVQA